MRAIIRRNLRTHVDVCISLYKYYLFYTWEVHYCMISMGMLETVQNAVRENIAIVCANMIFLKATDLPVVIDVIFSFKVLQCG